MIEILNKILHISEPITFNLYQYMKSCLSAWNDNIYIVPYDILQHFLSIKELTKISQLNYSFKNMVKSKTKSFIMEIVNVSHGVSLMKTFKNCELRLEITQSNRDDDISVLTSLTELTVQKYKNIQLSNEELYNLTSMKSLSLYDNQTVTDYGLSRMRNLTSLSLNVNKAKITNGLFKKFDNLLTLDLSSRWFPPEKYFGDNCLKHSPNLTDLDLTACAFITDKGLMHLKNLTKLDICNNTVITDNGIRDMIGLKELNCSINSSITDQGVKNLINLEKLYLFDNTDITDAGLVNLESLTELDLGDQWLITDKGISHLKNLVKLELSFNGVITDEAFKNFPELTSINLFANHFISETCVSEIKKLRHINVSKEGGYNQLVSHQFINQLKAKGVTVTYR